MRAVVSCALALVPFAALVGSSALVEACVRAPEVPVGMTHSPDRPTAAAEASSAPPPSAVAWESSETFRGWTRANVRRFISPGHLLGRWDADVYVNDVAKTAYTHVSPAIPLPNGAVVVEALTRAGPSGDVAGPIFALERRDGETAFIEMDASARVVRRGTIEPCAGCHAHVADQGGAFGLPLAGR